MIRKRVRAALEYAENECGGDFACKVWERENIDGVVFYSNYRADQFVVRHAQWVNEALEAACEQFGDDEHYAVMKAECNDRFLVAAFILATEYYLYQQLFVDANETITAARIEELRKLVKEINYDGGF
jgi:hypothetical protein